MVTIYKQQLEITDTQTISIPAESKLLSVQIQGTAWCVWYLCDTTKPMVQKEIRIYGTGHPFEKGHPFEDKIPQGFLGTIQDGPLVFHVFEVLK